MLGPSARKEANRLYEERFGFAAWCRTSKLPDDAQARAEYRRRFVAPGLERLATQSTFMAVNDYALRVEPWHALEAVAFGGPPELLIEDLEPGLRVKLLVDALTGITETSRRLVEGTQRTQTEEPCGSSR